MEKYPMQKQGEVLGMTKIYETILDPIGFGDGQLRAADTTVEEVEYTVEQAKRYMVPTSKHSPGQCIDGRCCAKTDNDGETQVGPKVAGGPVLTALAAVEAVGGFLRDDMTAEVKTGIIASLLEKANMKVGAHTTVSAKANKFINPMTGLDQTGCGAGERFIDSMGDIVKGDSKVINKTTDLTGRPFSARTVSDVPIARSYSAVSFFEQVAARNQGEFAEVLEGDHDESFLLLNTIRNTTLDRDAFVVETGKQAFVVDLWYIDDIADALVFGRADAEEVRTQLIDVMIAFQIATYKQLCDGSHRPVVFSNEVSLAA